MEANISSHGCEVTTEKEAFNKGAVAEPPDAAADVVLSPSGASSRKCTSVISEFFIATPDPDSGPDP